MQPQRSEAVGVVVVTKVKGRAKSVVKRWYLLVDSPSTLFKGMSLNRHALRSFCLCLHMGNLRQFVCMILRLACVRTTILKKRSLVILKALE